MPKLPSEYKTAAERARKRMHVRAATYQADAKKLITLAEEARKEERWTTAEVLKGAIQTYRELYSAYSDCAMIVTKELLAAEQIVGEPGYTDVPIVIEEGRE
jgi:hypothetical protein